MNRTPIEWATYTVNPLRARRTDETGRMRVGHYCEKVSPGCKHCYSSRLQKRFGMPDFAEQRAMNVRVHEVGGSSAPQLTSDVELYLDQRVLDSVLRRRKPERVFWADMTDIFGAWVQDDWLDQMFAAMALTPHHTHLVLTKRADRMHRYLTGAPWGQIEEAAAAIAERFGVRRVARHLSLGDRAYVGTDAARLAAVVTDLERIPLPNVCLMVSVERQEEADERIPFLLETPAAQRGLSIEPLLGPVDLGWIAQPDEERDGVIDCLRGKDWIDVSGEYEGVERVTMPRHGGTVVFRKDVADCPRVDWVIVGSESGPRARPCDLSWVRSIRDQCTGAGVAFFWKQHAERGRKIPTPELDGRRWVEYPTSMNVA